MTELLFGPIKITVNKKVVSSIFLLMVSWNAVFGAVGGLLLCLHENLTLHPEIGVATSVNCENNASSLSINNS
ncbi:MAG: hypothetical protein PF795_14770 [Kiritimatiellae bacterium]|nr:hypothetical protein [Kiritimatiellia bacterium]